MTSINTINLSLWTQKLAGIIISFCSHQKRIIQLSLPLPICLILILMMIIQKRINSQSLTAWFSTFRIIGRKLKNREKTFSTKVKQDNRKRNRHNEELLFEELSGAVETIDAVAHATGKTFNQVSGVYHSQAINRLTEILIDAGDAFDWNVEDIKTFISEQMSNHRKWCYDNQPLKVEIERQEWFFAKECKKNRNMMYVCSSPWLWQLIFRIFTTLSKSAIYKMMSGDLGDARWNMRTFAQCSCAERRTVVVQPACRRQEFREVQGTHDHRSVFFTRRVRRSGTKGPTLDRPTYRPAPNWLRRGCPSPQHIQVYGQAVQYATREGAAD